MLSYTSLSSMVPVTEEGGGILESVQRGNVDQCLHFIQLDRSVLKQKGKFLLISVY